MVVLHQHRPHSKSDSVGEIRVSFMNLLDRMRNVAEERGKLLQEWRLKSYCFENELDLFRGEDSLLAQTL